MMSEAILAGKPRLLMVDDSKVMRLSAKKMLGAQFDVVVSEDGLQGWQAILQDKSIQVVFTDLSMPVMDGFALLKKIRSSEDPGIAAMPVIVVTGAENDEAARERVLKAGATDFISKPFNSTDLTARACAHANYQREKQALAERVMLDELTGLGNLNHFLARLKQDLALGSRHQLPLSVMRLEVDQFNKLFIRMGREAANEVLKKVGKLLAEMVRKEDTAARTGLAQFAIALPSANEEGALVLAGRIQKKLQDQPLTLKGHRIPVSLSIGVLTPEPHPGQTARSVLEEAGLVLQASLRAGQGEVRGASSLSGKSSAMPSAPQPPAAGELRDISVDEALAMLAAGKGDQVQASLPLLRKKLQPLLRLMGAGSGRVKS